MSDFPNKKPEEPTDGSATAGGQPNALAAEIDALFESMQTTPARSGMKAAFAASADELGRAAVAAARSRTA